MSVPGVIRRIFDREFRAEFLSTLILVVSLELIVEFNHFIGHGIDFEYMIKSSK